MPSRYCPSYVLLCGPISLTIMDLQTSDREREREGERGYVCNTLLVTGNQNGDLVQKVLSSAVVQVL